MGVSVTNLLQGPAVISTGAFGAVEPANTATALGSTWTDIGGTDGGCRLVMSQTYSAMMVDQIAQRVGSRKVDQNFAVATAMAEATLKNLRAALNVADPGAETNTLGVKAEITNADPLYRAICIEGQRPGGGPRRIYIRRALSTENIEMAFTKDGKTLIPVTFTSHYVSASIDSIFIDDRPGP